MKQCVAARARHAGAAAERRPPVARNEGSWGGAEVPGSVLVALLVPLEHGSGVLRHDAALRGYVCGVAAEREEGPRGGQMETRLFRKSGRHGMAEGSVGETQHQPAKSHGSGKLQ